MKKMLKFSMTTPRYSSAHLPAEPQPKFVDAGLYRDEAVSASTRGGSSVHRNALVNQRVMIVEDEALVGFALEMELEELGATSIGPLATISSALNVLDNDGIDAAVLDIDLNGIDVYPLADHLIERGITFIFHTAHGKRRELFDVYPTVPVCIKPVSTDEVVSTLGRAVWARSRN